MEKKERCKPFPKIPLSKGRHKTKGQPYQLDYPKLKELYLEGPDYEFGPFCKRHNFNTQVGRNNLYKSGIDFRDWKKEWLKRQSQLQDEDLGPEILDLRKAVSIQRIRFVKDWNQRTQYMKTLLDAILKNHGDALQHDIQNTLAIQAGRVQRKFRMDAKELSDIASAANRLQDIETKSLMLTGDKLNHPQIMAGGSVGYTEDGDTGDGPPPDIEVVTMGAAGMSSAETAKLLSSWFDQSEKPKEEEPKLLNGNGVQYDTEENSG